MEGFLWYAFLYMLWALALTFRSGSIERGCTTRLTNDLIRAGSAMSEGEETSDLPVEPPTSQPLPSYEEVR